MRAAAEPARSWLPSSLAFFVGVYYVQVRGTGLLPDPSVVLPTVISFPLPRADWHRLHACRAIPLRVRRGVACARLRTRGVTSMSRSTLVDEPPSAITKIARLFGLVCLPTPL